MSPRTQSAPGTVRVPGSPLAVATAGDACLHALRARWTTEEALGALPETARISVVATTAGGATVGSGSATLTARATGMQARAAGTVARRALFARGATGITLAADSVIRTAVASVALLHLVDQLGNTDTHSGQAAQAAGRNCRDKGSGCAFKERFCGVIPAIAGEAAGPPG